MNPTINIEIIGHIRSKFSESIDARLMKKEISYIDIGEKYSGGLYKIEKSQFIDVLFNFHQSTKYELKTHTYSGDYKGVFATRAPERPTLIGVTTVELLERNGNTLKVTGLDALDGTPVLDIKPADTYLLQQNLEQITIERQKTNPRKDIVALVLANDTETLLLKAGQLHGHFCPGLAMGIMAATYAMNQIKEQSDGLEDLLAIAETNNCMSDGVQFVTGCTFGNNALIFKDVGKTAFTLSRRDGKGIRVSTRGDSKDYLRKAHARFSEQYTKVVKEQQHDKGNTTVFKVSGVEASLNTLKLDFDRIFNVESMEADIPDYAPSHDSILCEHCGEPVMATRIVEKDGKYCCLLCSGKRYHELTGDGIR